MPKGFENLTVYEHCKVREGSVYAFVYVCVDKNTRVLDRITHLISPDR